MALNKWYSTKKRGSLKNQKKSSKSKRNNELCYDVLFKKIQRGNKIFLVICIKYLHK